MFTPPEKLREEFDHVALRFEKEEGAVQNEPAESYFATDIKNYLSDQLPSSGKLALEIGSGLGSFTTRLATRFDRVVAIDLSPEMIRVAQKLTAAFENIEFIATDINKWDVPIARFDCVVSITTLHHMPLEPVLKIMSETLKPGGLLLVGDFYEQQGIPKLIRKSLRKIKKWRRKFLGAKSSGVSSGKPRLGHDPNESHPSMKEVYRACQNILPGARVVQHSRHYSIVWQKP
jgi:ubiquinone/menaquinone biosynthesis C-methylase UbiE